MALDEDEETVALELKVSCGLFYEQIRMLEEENKRLRKEAAVEVATSSKIAGAASSSHSSEEKLNSKKLNDFVMSCVEQVSEKLRLLTAENRRLAQVNRTVTNIYGLGLERDKSTSVIRTRDLISSLDEAGPSHREGKRIKVETFSPEDFEAYVRQRMVEHGALCVGSLPGDNAGSEMNIAKIKSVLMAVFRRLPNCEEWHFQKLETLCGLSRRSIWTFYRHQASGGGLGPSASTADTTVGNAQKLSQNTCLKQLIDRGYLEPGRRRLTTSFNKKKFYAHLTSEGLILYDKRIFNNPTGWRVYVKKRYNSRDRNTANGWEQVYYKGKTLSSYRAEFLDQS